MKNYETGTPDLAWQKDALCSQTDPEAFFPTKGGSTKDAKKICASCDVRVRCLEYALANKEDLGVWGGLSEAERKKVKQKRAQGLARTSIATYTAYNQQ